MNTNKGFGILGVVVLIAAVLVVGGGTYYATQKGKVAVDINTETQTETNTNTTSDTNVGSQSGTLRALLALGSDMKCTFSHGDQNAGTSGVTYISNGKMRGDFTSESAGTSVDSYMIVESDVAYVWSEAQGSQGIKMNLSDMSGSQADAQSNSSVNLDEQVDYKCEDWPKDDSKFTRPGNIQFMDMNAMIQGQIQGQFQGIPVQQ